LILLIGAMTRPLGCQLLHGGEQELSLVPK
jgi:hypothetical protein